MTNVPPASTYDAQLAERVTELLPGMDTGDRLELLGVMDPGDMRTSLAWLASHAPQMFDFALVRDRAMVERLSARLDEDQADDDELAPYCSACGEPIGHFIGYEGWRHWRGEGTVASPVELYDAGHEPVIAWRLAGAR
jgi:hypothetical protein